MRIIKVPTLKAYWKRHAEARSALEHWVRLTRAAEWRSLDDARATFPHADEVRVASGNTVTVFNVGGGKVDWWFPSNIAGASSTSAIS